MGHCQRKVCNFIVGEKNGEFALKNEQEQEQDSEQLSEQEQEQEYLTNLVYENNSLAGERERENKGLFLQYIIQNDMVKVIINNDNGQWRTAIMHIIYSGGGSVGPSGLAWKLSLSMCDLVSFLL